MNNDSDLEAKLTSKGAPYALLSEGEYIGHYRFGARTLADILVKASKREDMRFIVTQTGTFSYGEIIEKVFRLARIFSENYEIGHGERIGICLENSVEWIVTFFAAIACGATAVLLPKADIRKTQEMLARVDCSLVIASSVQIEFMREAGYLGHFLEGAEVTLLTAHINNAAAQRLPTIEPIVDARLPAIISFTSGSTGTPKAVVSSHAAVITGLMNMMLSSSLGNNNLQRKPQVGQLPPCNLILSPLSYGGGYGQVLLGAMVGGRIAIIDRDVGIPQIRRFVAEMDVTSVSGLDNETAVDLLREPADLSSLKSWFVHGGALRGSFVQKLKSALRDIIISTGYGLTETNGSICALAGDNIDSRPGSSGRVVSSVEIRIKDSAGCEVCTGVAGRIWLRGPMLMLGYREIDGSLSGLEDGWFNTGDDGFLDNDRHLHVLGRAGDGVDQLALHVWTSDIEDRIAGTPGIKDVCLVLAPKMSPGLIAAIVPNEEAEISELLVRVNDQLLLKYPDALAFACSQLPRTASGKIDRSAVHRIGMQKLLKAAAGSAGP